MKGYVLMGKITDLLKNRSSTRKFQDKPIPADVIADILEAGRLSPSGGNEQPWRFGVISDPGLIIEIARLAHGQSWIGSAPLLIVLSTVCTEDSRGARDIQVQRFPEYANCILDMEKGLYRALNQEEHQTKIAGTHMVLAALEHGIGSCWVSRFEVSTLARLLKLPSHILPSEILVFGYPDHPQNPAQKKGLDELVYYNDSGVFF
jgi:nitroreductase